MKFKFKAVMAPIVVSSSLLIVGCASNDELVEKHAQELEKHAQELDKQQKQISQLELDFVNIEEQMSGFASSTNQLKAEFDRNQDKIKLKRDSTYRVVENDNLSKIARSQGVSVDMLRSLNPQLSNPNNLLIGEILRVK